MKRFFAVLLAVLIFTAAYSLKTKDLVWHAADTLPIHGTLVHGDSVTYCRLPQSLNGKIRQPLADLGRNTAGIYIRFASDASAIGARYKTRAFNMDHMSATGVHGLDLYTIGDDGRWTTVASGRPGMRNTHPEMMIAQNMEPRMREYMLYLPLYDTCDSLYIGVNEGAAVKASTLDSPQKDGYIIMYGTSILQGGCASRPGMVFTSILGRMLDRQVMNLGFSGNGRLDTEVAELIAASHPSVVMIDVCPNIKDAELLAEKLPPFIKIIRDAQPDLPILVCGSPMFPVARYEKSTYDTLKAKNDWLDSFFAANTDPNLHYFPGEKIIDDDWEITVDNYHFTDLGFKRYAEALYPTLLRLLSE